MVCRWNLEFELQHSFLARNGVIVTNQVQTDSPPRRLPRCYVLHKRLQLSPSIRINPQLLNPLLFRPCLMMQPVSLPLQQNITQAFPVQWPPNYSPLCISPLCLGLCSCWFFAKTCPVLHPCLQNSAMAKTTRISAFRSRL